MNSHKRITAVCLLTMLYSIGVLTLAYSIPPVEIQTTADHQYFTNGNTNSLSLHIASTSDYEKGNSNPFRLNNFKFFINRQDPLVKEVKSRVISGNGFIIKDLINRRIKFTIFPFHIFW